MLSSNVFLLAVVAALLGQGCTTSAEAGTTETTTGVADFLKSLGERLAGLDSLSFEVERREPYADGPSIARVVMAKGERFRAETLDEYGIVTELVVSDGRFITEFSTVSEHSDGEPVWTRYGLNVSVGKDRPGLLLVTSNPLWAHRDSWIGKNSPLVARFENVLQEVENIDAGDIAFQKTTREGMPVWHLALKGRMRDGLIVLTVYDDTYFSMDTLLPVFQRFEGKGKFLFFNSEPSVTETIYRNMQLNPKLPDSTFEFTPPADAVFIDPEDDRLRRSFPIGQQAPALELDTVHGDKVRLSELRGKQAVLMSFWSTWCAPCLREMPTLIKLHEEFHDQGLAVIGVSIGDELSRVRSFVEARSVPYIVAHDADRKVADAFFVHGIPNTVLIDKHGIVRRVWQGWSGEDEEKEIRKALAEVGVGEGSGGSAAPGD